MAAHLIPLTDGFVVLLIYVFYSWQILVLLLLHSHNCVVIVDKTPSKSALASVKQ